MDTRKILMEVDMGQLGSAVVSGFGIGLGLALANAVLHAIFHVGILC